MRNILRQFSYFLVAKIILKFFACFNIPKRFKGIAIPFFRELDFIDFIQVHLWVPFVITYYKFINFKQWQLNVYIALDFQIKGTIFCHLEAKFRNIFF